MADGEARRYRGLLVDFGGVLTGDLFASFREFCVEEGIEPEAVGEIFRKDRSARQLLIDLETGALDEDEFEPRFAAMLGVRPEGLIERLMGGAGPDELMLGAVRAARASGIRTGLISNSWGTRRYDRTLLSELFDGLVISGEEGMRKPAPRMYSLGAERIGLEPAACVYVDDLPFNLEPAAELGMATIHHTDSEQTVAELERLLATPLRAA
jgi:epoxide hydrolase-like predicted phosphatase